ncbi:helix-turn-helix domain-containing protein [Halolactibacillus halophilus]|nr:helix-turn-helix domain-containing protein [Halolactibacillus halophilus]
MNDCIDSVRLFTEKEDIMIINFKYINGKKPKEIAKLMNRDEAQISNRIDALVSSNEWAKSLHVMQLKTKARVRELRNKKIIERHESGMSRHEISKELGIAKQTVTNVVMRWRNEKNLSES